MIPSLSLSLYLAHSQVNDKTYFEIANNQSIAQLSILLIIVGIFIMIVGAVGAVGAIFGNTIFGRITLGLVSSVDPCMGGKDRKHE